MNIKEMESSLKMKNMHFTKCSIEREDILKGGELQLDLAKSIENKTEHEYIVTLSFSAKKEDLYLEINAKAEFLYVSEFDDSEAEKEIINNNTVAIMFPFIRSQASLMTSQPGMTPILIPAINTTKLV